MVIQVGCKGVQWNAVILYNFKKAEPSFYINWLLSTCRILFTLALCSSNQQEMHKMVSVLFVNGYLPDIKVLTVIFSAMAGL